MRNDTKLVPIKQMKIGDTFTKLKSNNISRMASFKLVELCGAFCKIKVYDKEEIYPTEGLYVEVPLSNKEFKAKYKEGAAVIIEQLKNKMSACDNIGSHEMWNNWISLNPYDFAATCQEHDIEVVGWFELGNNAKEFFGDIVFDIGIVARCKDDDTHFWCHARKDWITAMMEEWEKEKCCD